ncbi:MAG: ABC transporter permease, partial [Eubacteriales bacterium]|nr:ABC transporter permease [Eubacteriales bacterium]
FRVAVRGVNQKFSEIASLELSSGRFFNIIDIENNLPVTVIGKNVVNRLFNYDEPIGETVIIKGIPFRVIGILEEQGMNFTGDQDIIAYIPYEYASMLFGQRTQKTYYMASESEEMAEFTRQKILAYLGKIFMSSNSYEAYSQTQMLEILDEIMGILTILLAGIASISLLVGGIGIMNIMLVTVRERTREIGIRKALGARRTYILLQFLTEAILITVIGGFTGLLFSFAGARLITILTGFSVVTGLTSILLALGFSITTGIIFGIYPAAKASRLVPVDALRFE